ncbi:hypothetical protein [Mycolicibacterium holsaticum]|uniref:hypothetical protein n=1 Tax=Mycolicibacterium holsaticum TaxID=152142 RepID=UPI001F37EFE7|nr:hypothetical protein [Mycolicibacterium holsaticum]
MELKAGTRLRSAVCDTGIIIVKPPKSAGEIRCGGVPMLGVSETAPAGAVLSADAQGGTLLGKRYVHEEVGLEVLCTKTGTGSLAFGDIPLVEQGTKPLPPSD